MDLIPVSLAEPFFWRTRERLGMNRVRSLLSTRGMLLGYSFEPRPNNRALATAGSVMTIGLSTSSKQRLGSAGEHVRLP